MKSIYKIGKVRMVPVFTAALLLCACSTTAGTGGSDRSSPATASEQDLAVSFDVNEKMPGMKYLLADNLNGYYFDIYSEAAKGKEKNGIIDISGGGDMLYMMIENAGSSRQLAVQIFVDYCQVPIIVNGKEVDTCYIDADSSFSEEIPFQLAGGITEKGNHKLTAAMTVSSEVHAADVETPRLWDTSTLVYDMLLRINRQEQMYTDVQREHEQPVKSYQDMWYGLLINDDTKTMKRTIPSKEIVCEPGEQVKLQYHIGGFENSGEVLMVLSLDMKQIRINGKDYLLFEMGENEIATGAFTFTAPQEPGLYDMTGWVAKNPFEENVQSFQSLRSSGRFTLRVK